MLAPLLCYFCDPNRVPLGEIRLQCNGFGADKSKSSAYTAILVFQTARKVPHDGLRTHLPTSCCFVLNAISHMRFKLLNGPVSNRPNDRQGVHPKASGAIFAGGG